MEAAMCTLISPDGDDAYREEDTGEEQFGMNSVDSMSIESEDLVPKDAAFMRLPDEIVEL